MSFYTAGEWIDVIDLEPIFRAVHRHRATKYNRPTTSGDFHDALRELDGAFLSYSSGRASYLNPSIRDFMASVIDADRDTAEDLLRSSIRFKQVESLIDLADEYPTSSLAELLTNGGELLALHLGPLINTPSIRWEKTQHGMSGHIIDLGTEARIGFLAELSERYKSTALLQLASVLVKSLVARWNDHVPEFTTVIRLLERLPANKWFLAHGGSVLCQTFLQAMLDRLHWATAADWLVLSDLPMKVMHWSAERKAVLDSAFVAYCDEGCMEERSECSSLDDMNSLKTSLGELGVKRSHDFKQIIANLESDIAETEEEHEETEGSPNEGFLSSNRISTGGENVTEEDVRQMFDTLCET